MGFFDILKRREATVVRPASRVAAGERIYAIGDIHGRDDLFDALLAKICADNAARDPATVRLILLGDLVDRGPQSAAVVDRAQRLGDPFSSVQLLIGNHEECFLAALTGDEQAVRYFIRIGGDATIKSYWGDDAAYEAASFAEVARILPTLVPQAHVDFLGRGEDMIWSGDYVFVHAGVKPGVPLDKQRISDLRWIREPFLSSDADFGAVVVHGHTIQRDVQILANRIGIDTGAYCHNRLTALCLEGAERWCLHADCETPA